MRTIACRLWSVVMVSALAAHVAGAQTRRPNIVFIVADDMGYGDVGFQGSKDIPTPNIDALARGGVRFTDAYVTGPYCSPTRAGLMTGRYPQRFGHEFNIGMVPAHADAGLPLSEVTLANRLHNAGYRTAIIGKWHLGSAERFRPRTRGFDEFFGFLAGGHTYLGQTEQNPIYDNDSVAAATSVSYTTDDFTTRAVDFVQRNKDRPFFLYLAYNAVHTPVQAPDKYLSRFANLTGQRRTYAAMLSAMDDGVGRVMEALRSTGIEENTLVVFFSDNGGPTTVGSVNGSSNGPLRGSKRETWEGGIRVPMVLYWKGRVRAGASYSQPVIQLDLHPTALAAAGIATRAEWKLDGVDLFPFVDGRVTTAPHDALYWRLGATMAIRSGDWKLVKMSDTGFFTMPDKIDLSGAELYNVRADIGEKNNVAPQERARANALRDEWLRWAKELAAPAWPAPPGAEGRRGGSVR
jgi:arylsulfatase A-like enzyme